MIMFVLQAFAEQTVRHSGHERDRHDQEASSAKTIVNANGMNSSPTIPLTRVSGRNTAMVTIVEDMIGTNISRSGADELPAR